MVDVSKAVAPVQIVDKLASHLGLIVQAGVIGITVAIKALNQIQNDEGGAVIAVGSTVGMFVEPMLM